MSTPGERTFSPFSSAALIFALCCATVLYAGEDELKDVREIRAVETYVPYDEFLKIAGKDPNASVMTLEEYRALVELATARNGTRKPASPPPIEAALLEAVYKGQAGDFSVRFDVQFKLTVASKEWSRIDLGPIQNIARITLDGQPGWIVLENGRSTLLVKGQGSHAGTLSFALPLQIEDDVQALTAQLLNSSAASVHMTVPGLAAPSSESGPLDAAYDAAGDKTSFTLTPAKSSKPEDGLRLFATWKRKYDSRKSEAMLQAEHHIAYHLNPGSPFFYWQVGVQIGRRKTGELTFAEPPGCRAIRMAGAGVHSWVRDGNVLRVLLDKEILGEVTIAASGTLDAPAADFVLGAPELKNARRNSRTIALYEPPGALISMTQTAGLRELALDERPPIPRFQLPAWEGRLARQYFVEQPGATAGARVTFWNNIFDTRTAAMLYISERSRVGPGSAEIHAFVELRMRIAVQPERGRIFTLNLVVPPQWKLAEFEERGTGRGASIERLVEGKEDNWTLKLSESADASHPLEIDLRFRLADMAWAENIWQTHALNFALPSISGARRASSHLGIAAHESIDVAFGEMPAWRSDVPGALARLSVTESALRAGLSSEATGGEVRVTLSHAPPRGEYESVVHVQTLEREVWVRAQIRLLALERARAVDELVLNLPADAKEPLYINGKGVREVAPGARANQRIIRFDQPWREVRMLRVEYRAPLAAETDVPVPDIPIEGNFDSRRWIVFQSSGVVNLDVKPGPSLLAASLDDTPSFGIPFKSGRALFAFTYAPGAQYGTYRTKNLESSPVLSDVVRELNLTSVIDASGVVRTHADFTLSHAQQYVEVKLPKDAKPLALSVDGESMRPVQGGNSAAVMIPLPPRSTARVELVYERALGALGSFGSLDEAAPEFSGFPVVVTNWNVCYPADYTFDVVGGNTTPLKDRAPRFFAREFFGRLLSGSAPEWSSWRPQERGERVEATSASPTSAPLARPSQNSGAQELKALENTTSRTQPKARAVGGIAIPEGAVLKTGKIGGSARMELSYRAAGYAAFAARAVFILAVLIGIFLMLRHSFHAALLYLIAGMLLGTLVPLALNWQSPLLMIPFCEGLTAFAMLLGAVYVSHGVKHLMVRRRAARLAAACVSLALAGVFASPRQSHAGEAEPVLIPYAKESASPFNTDPKSTKVYVPKSTYLQLMNRVKPEKKEPAVDAPRTRDAKPAILSYSLGNADYELSTDGTMYFIKGTLDVTTYDPKGWAKLPLDFGPAQLVALKIDGQLAGISSLEGKPFVQLSGAKKFTLEFELRGALELEAGRARVTTQVVPGGATRLTAVLPANVELDVKALPRGAWTSKDPDGKTQRCEITLGRSGAVQLSWHSPDIRAANEPRISSHSYTQFELGADGYAVQRIERVTAERAPVDQFSFKIVGDWELASVSAPSLAEWTISNEGGERRLRLWFQKPVSQASVQISGWAPLAAGETPAAGLTLENALHKEGFIGLKHGGGRRFTAQSLDGLKRASQQELSAAVTLPEGALPDRILHYNESPGDARVSAELEPERTALETQFAGVIQDGRMLISARTRYTVNGRGPLRYEVELPPNWEVRTVRATLLRDWEIVDVAGKKRLAISFGTRAVTGTEIRWSVEVPLAVPAQGALRLDLPQPRALGDAKTTESVDWILAAERALSLSQHADTTMQPMPVERAARWVNLDAGQEWRVAFRSSKADSKLALDVSRQESAIYATVVSFVRAAEEHVQINTRIRYRIERAGRDRFAIRLPPNAELIWLDAKNLRGRELVPATTGVALTVLMQSPVTGEQLIDLIYRLPRAPGKDAIAQPPSIEDPGTRGVEHFAGLLAETGAVVLAGVQRLHPLRETNHFRDAEELPFLPAGVSRKALTQVYSGEPGWSMTLTRTGLTVETGQTAQVLLSEIFTVVASDGRVRSLASYLVRNHTLQFLEIEMPSAEAKVWAVLVDGRSASVSHRASGTKDVLLIPLQRMTDTDPPARVSIVYEDAPAGLPTLHTSYSPKAPKVLDVPVVETLWRVYTPEGYDVSQSGGNVKEVVAGMLSGSRVSTNIRELERLAKIADAPGESSSRKRKALQSIAGQQQELLDNVTALNAESTGSSDEGKRISRDELRGQLQMNEGNLRLGNEWQLKLNETKRKKELEDAMSSDRDAEQVREFMDNFNFLNIRWRPGSLARKPARETQGPVGDMSLDDLRFSRRYAGYRPNELPLLNEPKQPDLREPAPPGGLIEETAGWTIQESGAGGFAFSEKLASELRMTQLNFRGVELHPELTLTFRSTSATLRGLSIVALVLMAGAIYAWRKRARRA